MKILTGALRGQSISFSPDPLLRPTTDKARKAIFDMLQGELDGKTVLDLFSGTGALGFESLSQGASHVDFVEEDREQCQRIKGNLARWKFSGSVQVHAQDVISWLSKNSKAPQVYDLIFLDPPYGTELAQAALEKIGASQMIKKGGFVFVECRKKVDIPPECGGLKVVRDKRYGQTKVLVYRLF